ncbi:MAG: molybdopterin molybdotransferase MoeA [Alphaproteobacteria bacterium]|nr:molybdopterin molybdotransferase MoeA [Alphaproteobacteria bacterium]
MLSVDDALARILGALKPLPAEQVSVADALGRALAEDVAARRTQPPAAVSAMDGYAVRAADVKTVPAVLKVIGQAPAGDAFTGTVGADQAVRIFTGGPVPDGADAIVMQENTQAGDGTVTVLESVDEGRFVRRAGLDFAAGDVRLKAGRVLTARDVGLAAAMNVPWLMVRRRPRVAILATGDEIVMPGDPIGPSQIVSSNSIALAAAIRVFGGEPCMLGIAPDDRDALAVMAAGAAGADLLLTSGGASVGDHDLVQSVLGEIGFELGFWKIAMRPGKPLIFGHVGDTPVLGLPGNPVSALVCAMIYLRPAMARMLGAADAAAAPRLTARLTEPLGENDERQDYLRAKLGNDADGGLAVTPFSRQDSSMLAMLAAADCLILRVPHAPALDTGAVVEILTIPAGLLSA